MSSQEAVHVASTGVLESSCTVYRNGHIYDIRGAYGYVGGVRFDMRYCKCGAGKNLLDKRTGRRK